MSHDMTLEMVDVSALIESDGPLFTAYGHAGVLLARSRFDGAQRLELCAQSLSYNGLKPDPTDTQEERRILTSFNAGWFVADGTFTVEAAVLVGGFQTGIFELASRRALRRGVNEVRERLIEQIADVAEFPQADLDATRAEQWTCEMPSIEQIIKRMIVSRLH